MALIRDLAALRHGLPVLARGDVYYPAHACQDAVIVYCRRDAQDCVCVSVNDRRAPIPVPAPDLYRNAAVPRCICAGKWRARLSAAARMCA